MTALDQAFIKAFSQQGTSPVAIVPRPAAPMSKNSPSPLGVDRGGENMLREEGQAAVDNAPAIAPAMFDRLDGILTALEKMPNLQAEPPNLESEIVVEEEEHGVGGFSSIEVGLGQWAVGGAEWAIGNEAVCPVPKSMVPGPEPQPSIPEPQTSVPEPRIPNPESRTPNPEPQTPNPKPQTLTPEPEPFRPAWQVDRFTWPRVCRRLTSRAAGEWDRLTDAMLAANAKGRKVLAITGCRRGEGATTLLLCAARRLAERGVKTALVDADLSRPRLAKRLGVQPQLGWNEISNEEANNLNQAVVETTDGNLALLAIRETAEKNDNAADDWSQWTACIKQLRNNYEMVLVDLGPLENSIPADYAPPWATEGNIDALLLVHNRRVTSKEDLNEMQRRLTETDINVAGMIENFVAM